MQSNQAGPSTVTQPSSADQRQAPPLIRLLSDPRHSKLIKQGAEAKVYKSYLSLQPPTLTHPSSSSTSSSSSSTTSTTSKPLPIPKPILLKYRFPKTYRHPSLSSSITASRTIGEARSLIRCLRARVNVPNIVLVDEKTGVIGLEWIEGRSVREWLGGGAEGDEFGQEGEEDDDKDDDNGGNLPELSQKDQEALMISIGIQLATLHLADVIHGDLTTSNMMVPSPFPLLPPPPPPATTLLSPTSPGPTVLSPVPPPPTQPSQSRDSLPKVILIDFGLSFTSSSIEDKAVDLYVLERAFLSTHPGSGKLFQRVLDSYGEEVERRWRGSKGATGSAPAAAATVENKKNRRAAAAAAAAAKAKAKADGTPTATPPSSQTTTTTTITTSTTRPAPGTPPQPSQPSPWKEIRNRLDEVRMRGRKRSMVG